MRRRGLAGAVTEEGTYGCHDRQVCVVQETTLGASGKGGSAYVRKKRRGAGQASLAG